MQGTGYFPGGEEQAYQMERDELNLVGTAEVPLTAYHMGEILAEEELPLKMRRAVELFPARGRGGRQGHLRPVPHPPVRQGRAGRHLPQRRGGEQQVPRGDPGQFRGRPQGPRTALPRRERLHGRPGPGPGQEVRHRDVDALPRRLLGNAQRQPVLRIPGPPDEPALQGPADQEELLLPHAEQHGDRLAADPDPDPGALPERRRLRHRARGPAAVHGRQRDRL